jgi:hypothetical protein
MAINRYYSAIAQDTALTATATLSATTLVVGAVTGFPSSYPFVLAIDYGASREELVSVTGVAGLSLTVQRGFNGTAAVAHDVGAVVRHVITAQDMTEMQAHLNSTTGAHGVTGAIVGTTDTQTLSGKTLTSPTIDDPKLNLTLNANTATTYTFVLTDNGKLVTSNNASAQTLSIPTNASVAFPVGSQINVAWITGAGQPTINAVTSGTTTILSTGATSTAPKLRVVNSVATCVKIATDTWLVTGDIS